MINTKLILDYLKELKRNNNKEWYAAHKEERKRAEEEFEKLIQELIMRIGKFDKSILHNNPKDLTFKLVRDTRFSHDKSPYNPTFRAHISSKGKLPIPVGYFISISPDHMSFLGGGLFADMFSDATEMIRNYLVLHPKKFLQIINDKEFMNYFSVLGTKLKNVPKGYDPDSDVAEFLKYKSFYLESYIQDSEILNAECFIDDAVKKFEAMVPFNTYLNKALKEFQMPLR
ncbi:DUF2461 domain-containing protein [Anaerorhabdus furcosa]|uniref:TIGR02453 family protein n=1 Tax=Anaerorhabdus furcosa TaxID=118967 RepID=A0A1T4L772_9FIRM|nr:DUF2461 domain-containing protein [Anaerorhabdus furcosa]SJZ50400.1 TIGR02453 family protein [Anaerorhabdus furcosa]